VLHRHSCRPFGRALRSHPSRWATAQRPRPSGHRLESRLLPCRRPTGADGGGRPAAGSRPGRHPRHVAPFAGGDAGAPRSASRRLSGGPAGRATPAPHSCLPRRMAAVRPRARRPPRRRTEKGAHHHTGGGRTTPAPPRLVCRPPRPACSLPPAKANGR